jgi:hypothetical protein
VNFVSFDEVKEKVWDVDHPHVGLPAMDREMVRRALRRGLRACLCPTLPGLDGLLPDDFYLSLKIDIDGDANYTTKLGGFRSHAEPSTSKLMQELTKMERCLETYLRTAGFDRKFFAGRSFRISYPFNHGAPCTDQVYGDG